MFYCVITQGSEIHTSVCMVVMLFSY